MEIPDKVEKAKLTGCGLISITVITKKHRER
jgi:hypothetical protein